MSRRRNGANEEIVSDGCILYASVRAHGSCGDATVTAPFSGGRWRNKHMTPALVLLTAAIGVAVGFVGGFDLGYTLGHNAGKRGAE